MSFLNLQSVLHTCDKVVSTTDEVHNLICDVIRNER